MLNFMTFKQRKLFPTQTVQNQNIDCPVFCDPSCPYKYNCFQFPDQDLIYPPPQPPFNYSHKHHSISPFVIIIIIFLSSLFLLVFYAFIVKHCGDSNRSSTPSSSSDARDEEQRFDENQGPVIDHPVWLITTVGLQQTIINSITVCKYKKDEGLIEETDCSVCLCEFREDDTLRLLPKCNHAFHAHCIDIWLGSHTNCPLCRAHIVSETVSSNSASTGPNSQDLSVNEETQMGNYQGDGELSENQVRSSGFSENRAGTEDVCELLQQVDEDDNGRSKEVANSNGNNGISQEFRHGVDNRPSVEDDEEKLEFKRSISMDSSSTSSLCPGLAKFQSEGISGNPKLDMNSGIVPEGSDMDSMEETLQNSSVSVKRSLSYGRGRSFMDKT